MRTLLLASLASLSLLGCSSQKDASSPDDHDHGDKHGDGHEHADGHEHGDHEKHHKKLEAGPVKDFHEVLAPVWHMEKGADRLEKACAAVPAMKEKGAAVVAGAAEGQKAAAEALVASVAELEKTCAGDKATVEATFTKLHDDFHAVMDGAKH